MKIAVLYICTGKYNQFFNGFYESCEKYFFHNIANKEYFVFTDDMALSRDDNVHLIFKQCEGFPFDSLFRFKMFKSIEKELKTFDYIYFFNSNAEFKSPVSEELLPQNGTKLVCGVWPIHRKFLTGYAFYPYERNKKSLAYIAPHEKPYLYYMGGLNGGEANAYLEMINQLADNIQTDYDHGIIAKVHDESHINKYFRTHPCTAVPKEYCCPEEWGYGDVKIIFRDKVKVNPDVFGKGRDKTYLGKTKYFFSQLVHALKWYM